MRYLIPCLLILLISLEALTQDMVKLSGRVIDAETQEPLGYATVGIKDKPIGVVTNTEGAFEINVSDFGSGDSLKVSMLGYDNHAFLISEYQNNSVIAMKQKPVVLDEIVVNKESLTAAKILENAIENIKWNYPTKPYMQEGFFRQVQITSDQYVSVLEAAFNTYDPGYGSRKKIKSEIIEIRRSHYKNNKPYLNIADTAYTQKFNTLSACLRYNGIRDLASSNKKRGFFRGKYTYQWDSTLYYNGKLVYVISATQKTNKGYLKEREKENRVNSLLIDAETFAILKVTFQYSPKDEYLPDDFENVTQTNDSIVSVVKAHTWVYEFGSYGGVQYLKYVKWSDWVFDYNVITEKIDHKNEYRHELLINKIITDPADFIDINEKMDEKSSLHLQVKKHNDSFWENYNVIFESPEERRLIENLMQESTSPKL